MATAGTDSITTQSGNNVVRELRGIITNTGVSRIAAAIQSGNQFTISMARFGSQLINDKSDDDLRSATDVYGKVYQCGSSAISCRLQGDDVISYAVSLSADVGNFSIGNFGLYDSDSNLIVLVALEEQVSKTNQTSAAGANSLSFVPVVQYSNVTNGIKVDIESSGNASIPIVINTSDIPDGTKSPYSAYIVQKDPNYGNVGNLFIFSNNSWEGMTPSSIGHYLYQNMQNAGVQFNAIVNDTLTATVLSGKRGASNLVIQGSYDLPPFSQYSVYGDGVASNTVASKSISYKFSQQTYKLNTPVSGNIPFQTPVTVQTSYTQSSSTNYPCYGQINGNTIVLDGDYDFLDGNTVYYVKGEYIPANTTISLSNQQVHDTIIRNKVQISSPLLKDVPTQYPCTVTAVTHYSIQIISVNQTNQSIIYSCPVDLPSVTGQTTMTLTASITPQSGKTPTGTFQAQGISANGDGTYTMVLSTFDSIVAGSYADVKVTTVTNTALRASALTGQNEISVDGSFDTSLTEYFLGGDAFQAGTKIVDYVPTLQNTTTITISNNVIAPDYVPNVTIVAQKTVSQSFNTYVSIAAFDKAINLVVAGQYDNVQYVTVGTQIYSVVQVTDSTDVASRTTITLSKPLSNDLTPGSTINLVDPASPIGDFNVLPRILSNFISKSDSQDYINKLNDLLQATYAQSKQALIDEANSLVANMGQQQQNSIGSLQTTVNGLQTSITNEVTRASQQENRLWQSKLDRTGGVLEGNLSVQDTLTVSSTGTPSLIASGKPGSVTVSPSQGSDGKYYTAISYASPNVTRQWKLEESGQIILPDGSSVLTSPTSNDTVQSFTVSSVSTGQFIRFPNQFANGDEVVLTLGATSQGYTTMVSYTGKTAVGFEVQFLSFDQQGNLLPSAISVLPELSIIATGNLASS